MRILLRARVGVLPIVLQVGCGQRVGRGIARVIIAEDVALVVAVLRVDVLVGPAADIVQLLAGELPLRLDVPDVVVGPDGARRVLPRLLRTDPLAS